MLVYAYMHEPNIDTSYKPDDTKPLHYYGDVVRICLIVAAFLMLATALVDKALLSFYLGIGVIGIMILTVLAGLTSPKTITVIYVEAAIAAVAFLFFEYAAIAAFSDTGTMLDVTFLLRQATAITFLLTLYYSTKSIRGFKSFGGHIS